MLNVEHLVLTNDVPSSADRAVLLPMLSKANQMVLDNDNDILRLERELATLQGKRTKLRHQRQQLITILSPLRILPKEILGVIFGHASEAEPWANIRVSQVCQLWRQAALSHSELWTCIRLGHQKDRKSARQYISTFIHRSHNRPMTLIFNEHEASGCRRALKKELHGSRWKSVTWISKDPRKPATRVPGKDAVGALLLNSSQTLEDFAIDHPYVNEADYGAWDLRSASFLRSFSLSTSREIIGDKLLLPWSQLTSLSLTTGSEATLEYIGILRQCATNLEECTLKSRLDSEEFEGSDSSDGADSEVVLPKLRKLHLYTPAFYLISSIKAPVLEDMLLHFSADDYEDRTYLGDTADLERMLKFAPGLKKLSIAGPGLSDGDLRSLIPRWTALEELTIIIPRVPSENVLDMLIVDSPVNADDVHLQKLQVFKLFCIPSGGVRSRFFRLADSRWWVDEDVTHTHPCVRLRQAVLGYADRGSGPFYGDDPVEEKLRQEGLDITTLHASEEDREVVRQLRQEGFQDFKTYTSSDFEEEDDSDIYYS